MDRIVMEDLAQNWNSTYERDWKFFATAQMVEYRGHGYQGLALPGPAVTTPHVRIIGEGKVAVRLSKFSVC